ncbi:hypothetical protein OIU78_027212 [Salix suchowensis]|nr:hypothetical protein OIU78_027212 [Salix suchowensis]
MDSKNYFLHFLGTCECWMASYVRKVVCGLVPLPILHFALF